MTDSIRAAVFSGLKRLVVKIGTNIIVDSNGKPFIPRLQALIEDIHQIRRSGCDVVLVSSGAVGLGMSSLNLIKRPTRLDLKQASASIGQIQLMHLYASLFGEKNQPVAQILLSGDDFKKRDRFTNIQRTVDALLKNEVIPIINENDTICTDEIKVGDNDKLSADVAHFLGADLLVIVSDAKGLFDKNPALHPDATFISVVPRVTSTVLKMGGGAGSTRSVGGMRAKLKAIQQATDGGTPVVLMHGMEHRLSELIGGASIGTLFLPSPVKLKSRKRWIAFVSQPQGKVVIDDGAVSALQNSSSSLLAAGIHKVTGQFEADSFIELCDKKGKKIGRGKSAYASSDLARIKGLNSSKIEQVLEKKGPEEVIHRDHLVIFYEKPRL